VSSGARIRFDAFFESFGCDESGSSLIGTGVSGIQMMAMLISKVLPTGFLEKAPVFRHSAEEEIGLWPFLDRRRGGSCRNP